MRSWHIWRIRRSYRRIARLEVKVTDKDVADLRTEFAMESVGMVDRSLRAHGYSRQQRRAAKRKITA